MNLVASIFQSIVSLFVAIKDLGQQIKHAGSANKLDSPWSKHCEEFKEPYACSYMQNLILSLPGIAFMLQF